MPRTQEPSPLNLLPFPKVLGSMTRQDNWAPDHSTGGFSVSYVSHEGVLVTINMYDGRLKLSSNDYHASIMCAHFIELKSQLDSLVNHTVNEYSDLMYLGGKQVLHMGPPSSRVQILRAKCRLRIAQRPVLTYLFLTLFHRQFLRIRCTYCRSVGTVGDQAITTFMDALSELLVAHEIPRHIDPDTADHDPTSIHADRAL